jgi:hypothetical protein
LNQGPSERIVEGGGKPESNAVLDQRLTTTLIAAADDSDPIRPGLDPAERLAHLGRLRVIVHPATGHMKQRWGAAGEASPVKLNTHALRTRFGCLSHGGSVPKRHGYRDRRGVDGKCPILSMVVGAIFTRTQPCVEVVREAPIHPRPQHICGVMIVVFEIRGLCCGFSYVNTFLFLFSHGAASLLIFAAKKELGNLGDQPTDDVHWGILSEQRWMRPVVEYNASRLLIGPRRAEFCHWLAKAEPDPIALEPACRAVNAVAANDRRHVLASYAALNRPAT